MKKIAIHSVPRSGSTWLGHIINSHPEIAFKFQPLFSYAFKDYLNEISSQSDIDIFFNEICSSNDAFINQKEDVEKGIIPQFQKEATSKYCCYKEVRYHNLLPNMLKKAKDLKCIFLIRNPLAVLYSWWNAPKEFRKDQHWDFNEEWRDAPSKNKNKPEEFNGYSKWKEATLLFLKLKKEYPKQVIILKYADLIRNPIEETEALFKFCTLEMQEQTLEFIRNSQSVNHDDAYSVYKKRKQDDQWQNKLPLEVVDFINKDVQGTPLEHYLDV